MSHKHKPSQKQLITGIVHEAIAGPDGTLIVKAVAQTNMPALFYQQEFSVTKASDKARCRGWDSFSPDRYGRAYKQSARSYSDMKYKGTSFELKNKPNEYSKEKLKAIDYCFTNDKWLNKSKPYTMGYKNLNRGFFPDSFTI
jgi:hypothetical protein